MDDMGILTIELTWVPAHVLHELGITPFRSMKFRAAEGTVVERLVGMNLRVDLPARRLVPAGPMPVASAA